MSLGKRVAASTLVLSLSNASVRMLALVTMPILTHLLSPAAYGTAAMAGTVISLVAVVALSGIDMSYARAYRAKQGPSGAALELFSWRYALTAGLIAGLFTGLAWWAVLAKVFALPDYLGWLLGFGIVLSLTQTMSLARARLNSRFGWMSVSLFASAVVAAAVAIGVAWWWRRDELPLILSMLAGYLVPLLVLGGPPLKELASGPGLRAPERIAVLKIGIAGILTAPIYWVISSLDRWFLGYFDGATSVGIYSIGYSVGIIGMMLNTAILAVWLPEAAREFEEDEEGARTQLGYLAERLILVLGVVWLAVTAAGGDIIRLLANVQYHDAAAVVPFIAGGVFFHGVLHLFNAMVLLKHKLHLSLWWYGGAGLLCAGLNLVLVPLFGRLGAATTQTLAFAVVGLGVFWTAQKLFPLKLRLGPVTVALAAVAGLGFVMTPAWSPTPWMSLLLKLPVGILATLVLGRVMTPEVFGLVSRLLASAKPSGR